MLFSCADFSVCWSVGFGRSQAARELNWELFLNTCCLRVYICYPQANRFDILCCIKIKGRFDPRAGYDILHIIMKYFAKALLYPVVRPFVLLFFGLSSTASLALLFRIQVGLEQTAALPKVSCVSGNGCQI